MAGLFMTPQQVRAQEAQQRVANPSHTLMGNLFNLGHAGGNAISRGLFDVDTRSAAEKQAAQIQPIMQMAASNPSFETLTQAAKALAPVNPEAAFKLNDLALSPTYNTTQQSDKVYKDKSSGRWFVRTEQTKKDGTKVSSLSQGFDSLQDRLDFAAKTATGTAPSYVGNIQMDGKNIPVMKDLGGLYIKVKDENGNLIQDRETPYQHEVFKSTEERATAGGRAQRFAGTVASKLNDIAIQNKLGFDTSLSKEDKNRIAKTVAIIADAEWDKVRDKFDSISDYLDFLIETELPKYEGDFLFGSSYVGEGEAEDTSRQPLPGKPNQGNTDKPNLNRFSIKEKKQ